MTPLKQEVDDDMNEEYDEAVPLVTADTPTNNGLRPTVPSALQIEGSEGEADDTWTTKRKKPMSKQHQSRLRLVLICVIVSMILVFYSKQRNTTASIDEHQTTTAQHHIEVVRKPNMTPKSVRTLREQVIQAHEKLTRKLQTQYGQYYEDIFFVKTGKATNQTKISRGSLLFESGDSKSNLSKLRFQRKLMMKLLEASAYRYDATTSKNGTLDTKFVWATGGHSATAGHGNFYNESYTAYIQYALEDIFRSVNIELSTRKYGMGGTAAGSELAMCVKEVFGTDFDVLVWDFGMTDGNAYWKQAWYNYRANLISNQNPLHFLYHVGSRSKRNDIANSFEQAGMAIVISNDDVAKQAEDAIPDSLGLSDEAINALPDYVRNYKCGNEIEKGEPYCQTEKYHVAQCPDRKGRVSWHPGWKWHGLMGYLAADYVISVLYDTMDELETQLMTNNALTVYHSLQQQAIEDYELFRKAPIPEEMTEIFNSKADYDDDNFNSSHILVGPNYCHIARLPAEIRYLGILTETRTQIGVLDYDKGTSIQTILKAMDDTSAHADNDIVQPMVLSYDENDRQICPIPINLDYKDFFYVGANTGWQQLTLPNSLERAAYNTDNPLLQGYVAICLTGCDWGNCPPGVWWREAYTEKNIFEMRINQVMVTNVTTIMNADCDLLRHADGFRFPVNETENTITIEGRLNVPDELNKPKSYIRISSWIVW